MLCGLASPDLFAGRARMGLATRDYLHAARCDTDAGWVGEGIKPGMERNGMEPIVDFKLLAFHLNHCLPRSFAHAVKPLSWIISCIFYSFMFISWIKTSSDCMSKTG